MAHLSPRLAVRALLLDAQDRLLLVNAYPEGKSDLWCAPGGGVNRGMSLHQNLKREVFEECGLEISVGEVALVNEFHDPLSGFHQVELFFRCSLVKGDLDPAWRDPEKVVTRRAYISRADLISGRIRVKPNGLIAMAWGTGCTYDPLETIVR